MLKTRPHVGAAALVALLASAPAALGTSQDGEFQNHEIKALASALSEALDTFDSGTAKKRAKAREDLDSELTKIGKKRKAPKGQEIQAALAYSADLGKALYQTNKLKVLAKGKVQSFTIKDRGISYAVHAPSKYNPRNASYPVCVIIPGLDDSKVMTAETLLQEYWTDGDLRDEVILVAVNMPEETDAWTERETSTGEAGGIMAVMLSVAEVRRTFGCDFDRFFIAGRGIGVPVATHLGNMFPHLFAGVIGRAGDAGSTSSDNYRNLPTYFSGGGAQATAFEEKSKEAGYDNCTLTASASDTDVLTWMRAHPRNSNPPRVTLIPGSPIPNAAYWIKVPPTDAGGNARIDAEADRESNTITITGSGVASVTLLFNDQLVDLSKPVKVTINGVTQEHLIPRNLDTVLGVHVPGQERPGPRLHGGEDLRPPGRRYGGRPRRAEVGL